MRKQSYLVVGILILIVAGAHYGGVDLGSATKNLGQDCVEVLQSMWTFFTDIFKLT